MEGAVARDKVGSSSRVDVLPRGDKATRGTRSESATMNTNTLSKFAVICMAALTTTAVAAPKTYQVTGPVLSVDESMVVVQKGTEKWEIARDAKTKSNSDIKVGDRVTIHYSMAATKIETKGKEPGSEAAETPAKKK
jgi:hypothetical protein